MTGYDLILYFTPIRVLKFSHNNQKHFWGNVLHFLTFSLSRNWYNGYIDKTKICGTLSNLTKICLIKLNKTKTYNYLYLTKLYIDICILSWFFFTIASTDTAIFVPEVNAPRDPWTDCFVHIGGRLFTFCQNITFNQRYLRTFAEKIRMK